jgi:hypothetical protein
VWVRDRVDVGDPSSLDRARHPVHDAGALGLRWVVEAAAYDASTARIGRP